MDSTEPATLVDLIAAILTRHNYRDVAEMADHTRIKAERLLAWSEGIKDVRPPTPAQLRILAADFGFPEAVVFRAAGREPPKVAPPVNPGEPATLKELLQLVMDTRHHSTLMALSRETQIPYSTLYAWWDGTRGGHPDTLREFARDFRLSPSLVFRAAGRIFELGPDDVDGPTLQMLHLWKTLTPAEQGIAERLMRDLAESHQTALGKGKVTNR
jgi:hypothetical protein